jgi:hypothetical protein
MRKPGARRGRTRNRLLGVIAVALLPAASVAACGADPTQPERSTREPFARSVVAAAAAGSVEQLEKLAPDDFINVRPGAQHLVDAVRGQDPASVGLGLSNDFPETADVQVLLPGGTIAVRFGISWGYGRWTLGIGSPRNPPSGGAKPGIPGDESNLKSNVRR